MPLHNKLSAPDGVRILAAVLRAAARRPTPSTEVGRKSQYAVRFAENMAELIASDLCTRLPEVEATTKRIVGPARGEMPLDVAFSTSQLGLLLGMSVKVDHCREVSHAQRLSDRMKGTVEDLRVAASWYHKHAPYAVMAGLLFLPFDTCEDGRKGTPSSFGSWVRRLRPYAGRQRPRDDVARFEKIYVGLYEQDGSDLRFFDVMLKPPKNGRPSQVLNYLDLLNEIHSTYVKRNGLEFTWAEGDDKPLN